MRPDLVQLVEVHKHVSIHAPWEGCDNPFADARIILSEFQFTHPGKGATGLSVSRADKALVSIHAPWEGCDFKFHLLMPKRSVFQFTHPGKGATRKLARYYDWINVSIHAPWEGCD